MKIVRSPICSFLGHVDHGKSSILDKIRGSSIVLKEAGGITQSIGASIIPLKTINRICSVFMKDVNKFQVPGLLFIDTPGHAAFTNLRKRGGNLADIAVLVIDINEGIKPQTKEAIEILKQYKTPFVIAANKIDLIDKIKPKLKGKDITSVLKYLNSDESYILDNKIYDLIGQLNELGINAERFDRVSDFTKQFAIVPVSAKTGDGIPELLSILILLSQKYLINKITMDPNKPAKGTILEVKYQKGMGYFIDVILYEGIIHERDTILVGTNSKPIITRVRGLLQPEPHSEMKDIKCKYNRIKQAVAATGIRIIAPNLDGAISGMPIISISKDNKNIENKLSKEIIAEINEVVKNISEKGVIVKADSLGSAEAVLNLLKQENIAVSKIDFGNVNKKDVIEASSFEDWQNRVIFAFNVDINKDAVIKDNVKIIKGDIIYALIDQYKEWFDEQQKKIYYEEIKNIGLPFKIKLLKDYVFRQSNPAVIGVHVLYGKVKIGDRLMFNGKNISFVKEIQENKESLSEIEKGKEVAMSFPNVVIYRSLKPDAVLYRYYTEREFKRLRELKEYLNKEDIDLLKEIANIMREQNKDWAK